MAQTGCTSIIMFYTLTSAISIGQALQNSATNADHPAFEISGTNEGMLMLRELGFDPQNVLDIGAYAGAWTTAYMHIFPKAQFMMVDGSDHTREWKNLAKSGRVNSDLAILDEMVRNVTWYGKLSTGDSMHKERTGVFTNIKGVKRQTQTLDALCHKWGLDNKKVGLLRLDVQGSELDVLRGAPKLLNNASNVEVIITQMPFVGEYNEDAPTFFDYVKFFDAAGFTPWDISKMHHLNKYLFKVDFMFIRKNSHYWNVVQERINHVVSR